MNPQTTVSIHPYFRPHEGRSADFLGLLPQFVQRTRTEKAALFYDFTLCDGLIFCREAYVGGEGALAHLENVGDLLGRALEMAELTRIEIHGAAAELDKMRETLKDLPVQWFVLKEYMEKPGASQ